VILGLALVPDRYGSGRVPPVVVARDRSAARSIAVWDVAEDLRAPFVLAFLGEQQQEVVEDWFLGHDFGCLSAAADYSGCSAPYPRMAAASSAASDHVRTPMPTKPELPTLEFADPAAWERWLERNHDSSPGIWLKIAKKGAPTATVDHPRRSSRRSATAGSTARSGL